MFGNKEAKQKRLVELVDSVAQSPGISQAELARLLQVTRATVYKDLARLEELHVPLYEDDCGRLYLSD